MTSDGNIFNFEVWNDDVRLRFSCDKTPDRIRKAVENLRVQRGNEKLMAEFITTQHNTRFAFAGHESSLQQIKYEAVFFENTQYPILIKGCDGVSDMSLRFSNVTKDHQLSSDKNLLSPLATRWARPISVWTTARTASRKVCASPPRC